MKILCSLVFGTSPDGDQWIASCPSLDIATVGDTREEALDALDEAVNLWIESCVRREALPEALRELGFVSVQRLPFTMDVVRIDDECYWRFPDYLPTGERGRLVVAVPESTPRELPDFQYQPHKQQTEMYA